MAELPPKRKANAKRAPEGVLGKLPASRPERIGKPRHNGTRAKRKPAAVTPGCAPLKPSRPTDAPPPEPIGAPKGTELVATSIRAVGELAQVGLVIGGRVLKRAVEKLPRP